MIIIKWRKSRDFKINYTKALKINYRNHAGFCKIAAFTQQKTGNVKMSFQN